MSTGGSRRPFFVAGDRRGAHCPRSRSTRRARRQWRSPPSSIVISARRSTRPSYSARPMMAPAAPAAWTAITSSTDETPPDAMTRPRPRPDEGAQEVEVGPLEKAVAVDRGDLEGLDARRGERRDGVGGRERRGALTPALAEREAVPDVDGRNDPIGAVAGDERARRSPDRAARRCPRPPGLPRSPGARRPPRPSAGRRRSRRCIRP